MHFSPRVAFFCAFRRNIVRKGREKPPRRTLFTHGHINHGAGFGVRSRPYGSRIWNRRLRACRKTPMTFGVWDELTLGAAWMDARLKALPDGAPI